MKVLMIICQDTPEVIWNAFRCGVSNMSPLLMLI